MNSDAFVPLELSLRGEGCWRNKLDTLKLGLIAILSQLHQEHTEKQQISVAPSEIGRSWRSSNSVTLAALLPPSRRPHLRSCLIHPNTSLL